MLSKSGQVVAGYNVQIAVDDKHKLIVASDVVNDGNDTGQLHKMAKAAKEELGAETLTALADTGYYNGNALKACEEDGIVAYVPQAKRTARLEAQDRISHEAFVYDGEANVYRCPAGQLLSPTEGRKINGGRIEIRYVSRKSDCDACALRLRCVSAKTPTRTVYRWEHEAVLERHRARMLDAEAQTRRRAELAEHPFGTLKCRAGYRHFLVRGFDKVRGEWSLMALCYNFTRVLNILGLDAFIAYLAKRRQNCAILLLNIATLIVNACKAAGRFSGPKSAKLQQLGPPHSPTLCNHGRKIVLAQSLRSTHPTRLSYSAASLCPNLALSLWISSSAASAITVPGGKIASAPALYSAS